MSRPTVSVILVNFRSEALLAEAVKTFLAYNPDLEAEIIVVDNSASTEASADSPSSSLPTPHWLLPTANCPLLYIPMPYNAGFARANNAGLKAATGGLLLLLNPDTVCSGPDLTQLARRMLGDGSIAAAGLQLLDAQGTPQLSGHRFVPWGLNHLLPLPYWGSLIRSLVLLGGGKRPHDLQAEGPQSVDWLSGACLMVSRAAYEAAGGFDEDFFLYAEEVEWCHRLGRQGKMMLFPDLKLVHLEGGAIDAATEVKERGYYNLYDRKGLQLMVSNHLRVRKQYGAAAFLFLLLNYTWGVAFFLGVGFLHRLFTLRNPFALLGRVSAFGGNVLRLWRLAPSILLRRKRLYRCL